MASYTINHPLVSKNCLKCKNKFNSNNVRKVYCSDLCATNGWRGKLSAEKKTQVLLRKRELRFKRDYGISLNELEIMKVAQDRRCAICKKAKQLVVDHNHDTGKIRGLLCHTCNRGLGLFSDSAEVLLKAAYYLEENSEN